MDKRLLQRLPLLLVAGLTLSLNTSANENWSKILDQLYEIERLNKTDRSAECRDNSQPPLFTESFERTDPTLWFKLLRQGAQPAVEWISKQLVPAGSISKQTFQESKEILTALRSLRPNEIREDEALLQLLGRRLDESTEALTADELNVLRRLGKKRFATLDDFIPKPEEKYRRQRLFETLKITDEFLRNRAGATPEGRAQASQLGKQISKLVYQGVLDSKKAEKLIFDIRPTEALRHPSALMETLSALLQATGNDFNPDALQKIIYSAYVSPPLGKYAHPQSQKGILPFGNSGPEEVILKLKRFYEGLVELQSQQGLSLQDSIEPALTHAQISDSAEAQAFRETIVPSVQKIADLISERAAPQIQLTQPTQIAPSKPQSASQNSETSTRGVSESVQTTIKAIGLGAAATVITTSVAGNPEDKTQEAEITLSRNYEEAVRLFPVPGPGQCLKTETLQKNSSPALLSAIQSELDLVAQGIWPHIDLTTRELTFAKERAPVHIDYKISYLAHSGERIQKALKNQKSSGMFAARVQANWLQQMLEVRRLHEKQNGKSSWNRSESRLAEVARELLINDLRGILVQVYCHSGANEDLRRLHTVFGPTVQELISTIAPNRSERKKLRDWTETQFRQLAEKPMESLERIDTLGTLHLLISAIDHAP